jgi:UDP-N-acetylmuramoylalanine--D-glutamate ligase
MAAILAARLMGCPEAAVRQGLAAFVALPHRIALVAEIAGVTYFDDSKATNVGAVLAALAAMNRPVVLIAGGRDKGGAYTMLAEQAGKKIKGLVLLGEAREKIAAAFSNRISVEMAADMAEAVAMAAHLATPGDVVLLSPACASFDMFAGYAQRGDMFQEAVRALEEQQK